LKNDSAIGQLSPTELGESTNRPLPEASVSQCTYFLTNELRGFDGFGTKRINAL
tara:strand:- start:6583 stop:6744 length:162 start_codon:yes stop_codon:yes gene_type:complete